MANVIKIKRTELAVAPTTGNITQGEMAYMEDGGTGDGRLYIGVAGPAVEEIGGKFYVDLLNSYDADLATFTLPASTTISPWSATNVLGATTQGAWQTALDVDPLGTDNSTDVTIAAGLDYAAIAGQIITLGSVDLTTDVAGDLPFTNLAQIATGQFLGRITAATGDIEVLTPAQAATLLPVATISAKGLAPVLSNVATQFLDGTGVFSVPAGGGDVAGPAANTDNTLARWDGVNSKTLQDTGIVVADTTNNITGVGTLNTKTIANLVSSTDASVAGWSFIDTNVALGTSNTVLPTQGAVKSYVDTAVSSGVNYKGAFDPTASAGAGAPDLDAITSVLGDMYTVTVAGTYSWTIGSAVLEVGDVLIAESAGVLNDVADWTIVQNNLNAATITTSGYVSVGAQTFGGTKTFEDIAGNNVGATLDSFIIDGGTF